MSDLLSISDAAKKLGIQRPTLSKIIRDNKIETHTEGNKKLVSVITCQEQLQRLSALGKLRFRASTLTKPHTSNVNDIVDHYKEELRRLTAERNDLQDKMKALVSENIELGGELKRLRATESQKPTASETHPKQRLSLLDKGKLITQILTGT